jgi:hypothetical protein
VLHLYWGIFRVIGGIRQLAGMKAAGIVGALCIAGAADELQSGDTLVHVRQGGEGLVGLGLIPVGDGVKIVRAVIGVAVLNARLHGFGKRDGRVQVEPIYAGALAG